MTEGVKSLSLGDVAPLLEETAEYYGVSQSELARIALGQKLANDVRETPVPDELRMSARLETVKTKAKPRVQKGYLKSNIMEEYTEMVRAIYPPTPDMAFQGKYYKFLGQIYATFENEPDGYEDMVLWLNREQLKYTILHPTTDTAEGSDKLKHSAIEYFATTAISEGVEEAEAWLRRIIGQQYIPKRWEDEIQQRGMEMRNEKTWVKEWDESTRPWAMKADD